MSYRVKFWKMKCPSNTTFWHIAIHSLTCTNTGPSCMHLHTNAKTWIRTCTQKYRHRDTTQTLRSKNSPTSKSRMGMYTRMHAHKEREKACLGPLTLSLADMHTNKHMHARYNHSTFLGPYTLSHVVMHTNQHMHAHYNWSAFLLKNSFSTIIHSSQEAQA